MKTRGFANQPGHQITGQLCLQLTDQFLGVGVRDIEVRSTVDWIQYNAELLRIPAAQWVERARGDRPPAYTSNNFLAMRSAAVAGLGAMLLPLPQGRAAGLVPLDEIVVELPEVRWYLVVHRALRRVPRIVAVLDLLDELIREVTRGEWLAPTAEPT